MRRLSAAASTVGTVLGLVLLLMGVTGGIAAYRIWQAQQTLDRAAAAAATSEAQNGCWTASTSAVVTQILQGGGLPVTGTHAVQVTQYSSANATPATYGQLVTAGFQWAAPLAVVHLTLPTSMPLAAQDAQPSQYVPGAGDPGNPGCLTLAAGAITAGNGGSNTNSNNNGNGNSNNNGNGNSGNAAGITVTSISAVASTDTVTVAGTHLPVFSQGESVYGGEDFPNFLWSIPGSGADGNPTYPYAPDWGVQIVTSTPTSLVFQPANTLSAGQTWSLYLVPAGQQVGASTAPVGSATVGGGGGGGVYG